MHELLSFSIDKVQTRRSQADLIRKTPSGFILTGDDPVQLAILRIHEGPSGFMDLKRRSPGQTDDWQAFVDSLITQCRWRVES